MKFIAQIDVMPKKGLLDPQGKAVSQSMGNIGLSQIGDVRIGKHITLEIEANNKEDAEESAKKACEKLLANPIMESYSIHIEEA